MRLKEGREALEERGGRRGVTPLEDSGCFDFDDDADDWDDCDRDDDGRDSWAAATPTGTRTCEERDDAMITKLREIL